MGIKCAIALLNFEGRNDRVEMVRHNSSISVGLEIKKKKKKESPKPSYKDFTISTPCLDCYLQKKEKKKSKFTYFRV